MEDPSTTFRSVLMANSENILPRVLYFARRLTRARSDWTDAEDLVSEAVIRGLERSSLRDDGREWDEQKVLHYLLQTTRSLVFNMRRKSLREMKRLYDAASSGLLEPASDSSPIGDFDSYFRDATSRTDETLFTIDVSPDLAAHPDFVELVHAIGDLYRAHGGGGLVVPDPGSWNAMVVPGVLV